MRDYNPEFLYLTTTGWKSGQPHEIEIWFVEHAGRYYLCAEQRENSHWVQNIRHNERISFWVNGETYQGTGRILESDADSQLIAVVSGLFDQNFKWSDGLLAELSPDATEKN